MGDHSSHIGVDFDDTLLPMRERVAQLLTRHFGKPDGPEIESEFRASRRWGLSKEQFQAWFTEHQAELHDIEPYPGVGETLAAWSGFAAVHIVTGRSADQIEHAALWVRRHRLPIVRIHCAPSAQEKAACAAAIGVRWFVEDHDETARAMADLGIDVMLFGRPYNRSCVHARIHGVRNWQEVAAKVERDRVRWRSD